MAARQANQSRRSWKDAATATPASGGSTIGVRVFLTLGVVALIGLFAWLLIPVLLHYTPQTHVIALRTGPTDRLLLPPLLFEQETLVPLAEFAGKQSRVTFQEVAQQDLGALGSRIKNLDSDPRDVLVVYVSAHGVSDDGVAYLLTPGFDLASTSQSRRPVSELLKVVSASPAEHKLLVLDCGRMGPAPRIGTFANEFAALVAADVNELNDPSLWVLTSNSELETSPLGLASGRSSLGGAVADALTGIADDSAAGGDDNGDLSLAELFGFAVAECYRATGGGQHPQLFHATSAGGESGPETVSPEAVLLVQRIQEAEEESDPDADAETPAADAAAGMSAPGATQRAALFGGSSPLAMLQAPGAANSPEASGTAPPAAAAQPAEADEQPPTEGGATSGDSTAHATAAAPSTSPSTAPSTGPPTAPAIGQPAAPLEPAIQDAWRRRDRLEAPPQNSRDWRPVDYAPQHWSELNALLAALSLERLGGEGFDQSELARQVNQLSEGLASLAEDSAPRVSVRESVADDLLRSRGRLQRSQELVAEHAALPPEYSRAVGLYRTQLGRARWLVAWLEEAYCAAPTGDRSLDESIAAAANLLERLAGMQSALASLSGRRLNAWRDAGSVLEQGRALETAAANINRAIDQRLSLALRRSSEPLFQRQLETLFASPLLTADQRIAIADAFVKLRESATTANGVAQTQPPTEQGAGEASLDRWRGLLSLGRLEQRLISLGDASAAEALDRRLQAVESAIAAGDRRLVRQEFRAFGAELQAAYSGIAERAQNPSPAAADRAEAARLAALVHPADAERIGEGVLPPPLLLAPRALALSEIDSRQTVLSVSDWTPVAWEVSGSRLESASVEVEVRFDADSVRLKWPDETELRSGEKKQFRLASAAPTKIELLAQARRAWSEGAGDRSARVALRATSGDVLAQAERGLLIPLPNQILLAAEAVTPRMQQSSIGADALELAPFPNRTTDFRFSLANSSDEEKRVRVELFAVPRLPDAAWPPGRLVGASGEPFDAVRRWAASSGRAARLVAQSPAPIVIPTGGVATPAPVGPPGGAPPATAPGAEGAPAAPPPPPASADITNGLLCVITNVDKTTETWTKWVEISALAPTDYATIEGQYDAGARRIEITVRPVDLDGDGRPDLPPGALEQPLTVLWPADGDVFTASKPDEIRSPDDAATVSDRVPEQLVRLGEVDVPLEIDGWPRAYIGRATLERNGPLRPLRRDRTAIQIDAVRMPGAGDRPDRIYQRSARWTPPPAPAPSAGAAPPAEPTIVRVGTQESSAFDTSTGVRPIDVWLRVDAPFDAFTTASAAAGANQDFVELRLQGDDSPVRLYDDRLVQAELAEFAEGAIRVSTTVGDHVVTMRPPGTNNERSLLRAELLLDGVSQADDRAPLVFDGAPPEVLRISAPEVTPFEAGAVRVDIQARDLSGVESVDAWLLEKERDELDAQLAQQFTGLERYRTPGSEVITAPLNLKLSDAPGTFYLRLRVTDRSGQQRVTLPQRLDVRQKPKPADVAADAGPLIGTIKGQAILGARPAPAGIKIRIKDAAFPPVSTDSSGKFSIPNVPGGQYTMLASGTVTNRPVGGEADVTLSRKEDYASVVMPVAFE